MRIRLPFTPLASPASLGLLPVVSASLLSCAPPDELTGAVQRDVTTATKQLVVQASIDEAESDDEDDHGSRSATAAGARRGARLITLAVDDVVVWSCTIASDARAVGPACAADDDQWYRGPGLYTFAMGDDFATDVWVHDDVVRLVLEVSAGVVDGTLEIWRVSASAFADGNSVAPLVAGERGADLKFRNESGVDLMKKSMTASLEKWDGEAWREVPRAPMFLCGTGWNPLVGADDEQDVWLPLSAHLRAMEHVGIEKAGTFRVSYPFRLVDEDAPRIASTIIELDEGSFREVAYSR